MQNDTVLSRSPALLNRKFVEYLVPTLFMNISLAVTNVVNAGIVGQLLGPDALAAVNLCMPAFSLGNAVFNIVIMGACTLIIANKGAMDQQKADRIFTQLAIIGMGLMLSLGLVILFFLEPLSLVFMGGVNHPEIQTLVKDYLFPLAFSFPFIFIALGGAMVLRTDGHPHYGAWVILISNIANLAADLLFICVFNWGVAGAAWATVTGFACGAILALLYFPLRSRTLHFCWLGKSLFRGFWEIVMTGLPSGCTSVLQFARILLLNMLIFRLFKENGAAAFAVCLSIQYFAYMFLLGVTGAMQPVSAMLFGEKDYSGMQALIKMVLWTAVSIALFFSTMFLTVPDLVGAMFGMKEEGLALLPRVLAALALSLPFCSVNYFYLTYCQTIRRLRLGLTIAIASGFGFIALLAPVFYWIFPDHFWYILAASEILTSIMLALIIVFIRARQKVSLILLPTKQLPSLEFSLRNDTSSIIPLMECVKIFCIDNNIDSERTASTCRIVQERVLEIVQQWSDRNAKKKIILDVIIKIDGDEIVGRFRDPGNADNPLESPNSLPDAGIGLIRHLAKEVSYMRTLGFNVLVFRV